MSRQSLVEIDYYEGADGMLYPDIQISTDKEYDRHTTHRYGSMWKEYLSEHHPLRLSELIMTGSINEMIVKVDRLAEQRKEVLIQQLLENQPMPAVENILVRAGHLEMLTSQAEEIVIHEVVYQLY
jgi:hypothetical protein